MKSYRRTERSQCQSLFSCRAISPLWKSMRFRGIYHWIGWLLCTDHLNWWQSTSPAKRANHNPILMVEWMPRKYFLVSLIEENVGRMKIIFSSCFFFLWTKYVTGINWWRVCGAVQPTQTMASERVLISSSKRTTIVCENTQIELSWTLLKSLEWMQIAIAHQSTTSTTIAYRVNESALAKLSGFVFSTNSLRWMFCGERFAEAFKRFLSRFGWLRIKHLTSTREFQNENCRTASNEWQTIRIVSGENDVWTRWVCESWMWLEWIVDFNATARTHVGMKVKFLGRFHWQSCVSYPIRQIIRNFRQLCNCISRQHRSSKPTIPHH